MDKRKNKKYNPTFRQNTHTLKGPVHNIKPLQNDCDKSKRLVDDWNFYMPDNSYDEFAHFNGKLKAVEIFMSDIEYASLKTYSETRYFRVNVNTVLKNKEFLSYWPDFMKDLVNTPKVVIGLFGFSMEQILRKYCVKDNEEDDITDTENDNGIIPLKLNPRFLGFQNYSAFQDLKMCNYSKFLTLLGTVVRVTDIKPFCICIAFTCGKCHAIQVVLQNKGCYTVPNACSSDGCSCRIFKPLLNSPLTKTVPKKNVWLQELNMDNNEGGRVPRTVECELTCDLTDSCMPGDTVIISGIVTANNTDDRKLTGNDVASYILYLSANSVVCLKGKNVDSIDFSPGHLELKSEDLGAIQKIHAEDNLFRLIVASLCPNIYGHELIKAGLVLGLFGGRDRTHKEDKNKEFSIRENSHILIVGDPGLGKSQMLLACANISPRGVYVCGNSTTASGLTVTISKEGGGENSLEAGALVLADQGHCCIDEFDKMMHQHSALLEAMEQQTISIAKSGVVCTLPARTSILAAANPSGGHYNRAKTVSENLRIGGSLLSRFDLVFIVQDHPDQDLDNKMSSHVMGIHTYNKNEPVKGTIHSHFSKTSKKDLNGSNNLLKRLRIEPNEKLNYIPPAMLQKYIAYARKFSQPKLLPEVSDILQEFYLDMRKQHKLNCSTPITTRQLESLIRLTEARARIELRSYCTKNDAEEVIEIMKYSMSETYSDEFGNIDFERSIHGSGMSKASQAKKLIKILTDLATTKGDDCFTFSEIQHVGNKLKMSADSLYSTVSSLNDQGFLLKKGYQLYQLQTL